jgi:hypothetical protein
MAILGRIHRNNNVNSGANLRFRHALVYSLTRLQFAGNFDHWILLTRTKNGAEPNQPVSLARRLGAEAVGTALALYADESDGDVLTTYAQKCATLVTTSAVESMWRSGRVVECRGLENR